MLCQLSYAPRFERRIVVASCLTSDARLGQSCPFVHHPSMTESEEQQAEEREEFLEREGEILREDQEHKGYGEDEGEREESLPDE